MNTEPMVTLKPHRYGTKALVAGDSFKASKRDVNLLEALGRAKRDEKDSSKPAVDVTRPAAARRNPPRNQNRNQSRNSSRRYNRRDMHAKD